MKHSPKFITSLKEDEVFVFGSNESGMHGAGAARQALQWGAQYGKRSGIMGQTYGIPTVKAGIKGRLPIVKIAKYVDEFIQYAKEHPEQVFLVTEIGCGLAGYEPKDIAPLFKRAVGIENILLPKRFIKLLNH